MDARYDISVSSRRLDVLLFIFCFIRGNISHCRGYNFFAVNGRRECCVLNPVEYSYNVCVCQIVLSYSRGGSSIRAAALPGLRKIELNIWIKYFVRR